MAITNHSDLIRSLDYALQARESQSVGLRIDISKVAFCGQADALAYVETTVEWLGRFGHVHTVSDGFGGGTVLLTGPTSDRLVEIQEIALDKGAPRTALRLVFAP